MPVPVADELRAADALGAVVHLQVERRPRLVAPVAQGDVVAVEVLARPSPGRCAARARGGRRASMSIGGASSCGTSTARSSCVHSGSLVPLTSRRLSASSRGGQRGFDLGQRSGAGWRPRPRPGRRRSGPACRPRPGPGCLRPASRRARAIAARRRRRRGRRPGPSRRCGRWRRSGRDGRAQRFLGDLAVHLGDGDLLPDGCRCGSRAAAAGCRWR